MKLLGVFLLLSVAVPALPQQITPITGGNGIYYYEIGGARVVAPSPNPAYTRVTLGGSIRLGLGYSCGKFDPLLSVTNILNDISQNAENFMVAMVTAAQAAIASLPAYILQRANPGLYDLFQNALLKAEETLALATKSCEQLEAEIAQGKDPFREWIQLSMGDQWRYTVGTQGDIVKAKEQIEDEPGKDGLPWIGGSNKGGENQDPINVIGDTVTAGYNIIMGRNPTASGPPAPVDPSPLLTQLWASPDEAAQWATSVLGETHVTTCDGCPKNGEPGIGLHQKIEEEITELLPSFGQIVNGDTELLPSNLEAIVAPGVAIGAPLIKAIRDLPNVDKGVMIGRLVGEIATARSLEKALMVRRMLLTGQRVPEVKAAEPATKEIVAALTELDREVDNIIYERDVRRIMVSDTAKILLRRHQQRQRSTFNQPQRPAIDGDRLEFDPYSTQIFSSDGE